MKHFLKRPSSIWNFIPNHSLFSQPVINLYSPSWVAYSFFRYLDSIEKLPAKLSSFHKQMLLAWSLIYKLHNFSPHSYFIWNNHIFFTKTSPYFFKTGMTTILAYFSM